MILEETVLIKSHAKNEDHYRTRGYTTKGNFLVKIKDLPPSSHKIIHVVCDYCGKLQKKEYCVVNNKLVHKCGKCAKQEVGRSKRKYPAGETTYNCEHCKLDFVATRERIYIRLLYAKNKQILCIPCDRKRIIRIAKSKSPKKLYGSLNPNYNPNKSDFQKYKNRVMHFTEKNYELYKEEINPYNYKRTLCGVENGYQLDHIISIKEGFEKGVLPTVIGSKENLQMLTWQENNQKKWY